MTEYSVVSDDTDGRCTIDEGTDLSSIASSGKALFSDGLAGIAVATPSIFDEENRRVFRNICGNYEFKWY